MFQFLPACKPSLNISCILQLDAFLFHLPEMHHGRKTMHSPNFLSSMINVIGRTVNVQMDERVQMMGKQVKFFSSWSHLLNVK